MSCLIRLPLGVVFTELLEWEWCGYLSLISEKCLEQTKRSTLSFDIVYTHRLTRRESDLYARISEFRKGEEIFFEKHRSF